MEQGGNGRGGRTTPGTPGTGLLPGTPARTPRTPGTPSSVRLVRGSSGGGPSPVTPGGGSSRTSSGGRTPATPGAGSTGGGAVTPGTPSSRRNNGRVSIASMGSSTSSSGEGGLLPGRIPNICDKQQLSPYNVMMPNAMSGNVSPWTPVSPGPSRGHIVNAAQNPSPFRYGSTSGSQAMYQRQLSNSNINNSPSPYYGYDQMQRGHKNLPNGHRTSISPHPIQTPTSNKTSLPNSTSPNPKNMFTAIYEYKAQGEDELSLQKGDTIEVLSKDYKISGDEGWWTGKCNGKVGVFPCNFVAPCDLDFSDFPREELLNFYPPHISYDQLNMADLIGVGGFGKVFRGHYQGQEIAIKTARAPMDEDIDVTRERVRQEARLLWVMKHTNVISLKGVCLEGPDMCLIMEYARGGSLNRVLQSVRRIGPDVLIDWAIQIARGMVYLHDGAPIKLIHRDLKSANGKQ